MKFKEERSFASPEAAEKKLLELANAIEADHAGRVTPAAANQRQAPSSRGVGAVHDGHERSEFGRMQASRRPNQR